MDQEQYDSTLDTMRHSRRVDELLLEVIIALQGRVTRHDLSKMAPPEKAVFDRVTPLLKSSTYGSEAYKASLADMGQGWSTTTGPTGTTRSTTTQASAA